MDAVYISSNSFTVIDNRVNEFISGRRVKLNCGVDGLKYSTILSSSYSDPNTTVIINENEVTSNLISVAYGVVQPGNSGSLPDHTHSSAEGTGGLIDFIDLNDTPTTFSGAQGKYLMVDGDGVEFVTLSGGSGSGTSDVQTLLDLSDTPTTYSGAEGQYLVVGSTCSGIEFTEASTSGLRVIDVYDNTGGQTFTTSDIILNLDTTRKNTNTSEFVLDSDVITINETDTYVFIFRVSTTIDTGTAKSSSMAWLEKDEGSGYFEIDGTRGYMYNHTLGVAEATCTVQGIIDVTSGDKFRICVNRFAGTDTITTIANGSGLTICAYTSRGAKGKNGENAVSLYGTGDPPDPSNYEEGTVYFKYYN